MTTTTTTEAEAERLAKEDALDAIRIARDSVEPVAWITGNSFMPPLRDFGHAEFIWQSDDNEDGSLWEAYFETFESAVADAGVYLDCPDYDNALYVVDLSRFEYDEDAEGDSLQDEWRPI